MVLKSNKELVDIKADFSSTNNDELILRNSVEERNKLIETEYSYYAQDKKYASGFNYGTFYEASGDSFTNRNILINYMNQKIYNEGSTLFGWDYHTDWGKEGRIERKIGKLLTNIQLS